MIGVRSYENKISGFLSETKQLLASRSNLKRSVLDVQHLAGIEIVSPNFMNKDATSIETRAKIEAAIEQIKKKIQKFDQLLNADNEIKKT